MSSNIEYQYDKTRSVRYTAKEVSTRIAITRDAWDQAARVEALQERVAHILEQDPIKQVNVGYGIKYEPTLGGWVFHTGTKKYLFAPDDSGNRAPRVLLFESLKKPKH